MSEKQRVTVLVGAGAVLDFRLPAGAIIPTTGNITNAVVNKTYFDYFARPVRKPLPTTNIVKDVFDRLKAGYGQDGWKVNFETLFHTLESLYSYLMYWKNGIRNMDMMPANAPLLYPLPATAPDEVRQVMQPYIMTIMNIVGFYNTAFKKNLTESAWYRDFWRDFTNWDIFNLNYDTTIEDSLSDYTDGFEEIPNYDFRRFNPHKMIKESEHTSVVCHPHGCILYGADSYKSGDINNDVMEHEFHDFYKYRSYTEALWKLRGTTRSNATAQDGMTIWDSPIITGLRKMDKLNLFPFAYYNSYFNNAIQRNRSIVIVGYSFGDVYINEWLQRIVMFHGKNARVVLIDKWPDVNVQNGASPQDRAEEKRLKLRSHEVCNPLADFINRISNEGSLNSCIRNIVINDSVGPMYSSNGCLMLFTDGFRDAAENYKDIIYSFLNI